MNKKTRGIIVLTVVAIFGLTTLAFAGWGSGHGHMMRDGDRGMGSHHRDGYGHGQGGNYSNLSEDEIAKLDKQRADFLKATDQTRQKLYEKELALRSELAKENPDTNKASNLQSEISKLQSDLDQKRLDYEIKARKSAPSYNRSSRGNRHMTGYGPHGSSYCRW